MTDLPGVLGQTCQGPRLAYLRQVPQAAKSGEHTQGGYAASPGGAGTVSNDDLVMITDALEPYRFLDTIIAISSTAGLPLLGRVLDTMSRAVDRSLLAEHRRRATVRITTATTAAPTPRRRSPSRGTNYDE